jgi:transcriptional regulator with XRE-family HTH domain
MKKIIGDKIRVARKGFRDEYGKKISQAELGFRTLGYKREKEYNASQQKLQAIESGTYNITIDELLKISKYLKKPIHYFLEDADQQPDFMCGWPEDAIEYCQKLKNVLENGEDGQITAIKDLIDTYTNKIKPKKIFKKTGT